MSNKKYSWDGTWQAPGHGRYVICDNDSREMEPGEVVELLDRLADLQEQLARRPSFAAVADQIIEERRELWERMANE